MTNIIDFDAKKLNHMLDDLPQNSKTGMAIAALLAGVNKTDLVDVCKALGWIEHYDKNGNLINPTRQHFKVAIVHQMMEYARLNNWHLVHDSGFFYIYDRGQWIALVDAQVKQLLTDAAINMSYPAIESSNANFVEQLFKQAEHKGFFTERNYKKQSIINLANGSLVLSDTGVRLKSYDYRDFLTHKLDFNYDPTAVNQMFLDYLAEVLPDEGTRKTLQQVAGYLFVKGLKLEKVFFLYGTGSNGKSVFFEVLNGVLGSDNVSTYTLESITDDKGYHRAMIKDKIVNYGSDIKLTNIDAGNFKTLASGEPIEARLPFKDPFIMTDYAKLIFNVNRLDNANIEHTHGFYRRLLIVPFMRTIADDEQDRDLHTKILKDKAGVLNWMIEGAEEVIKSRDIYVSDECHQFKTRFIRETDTVAMFEDQHIMENLKGTIYFKQVTESYSDYKDYCMEAGHRHPLGRNNFVKRMEVLGFNKSIKECGTMLEKCFFKNKVEIKDQFHQF